MKKFVALAAFILILTSLQAQTTFPTRGVDKNENNYKLITGAILHLSPGETRREDMLIHQGKIIRIGKISQDEIPENTVTYDYSGYHIFPSFIELDSKYGMEKPDKPKKKPGPQNERKENIPTYWNEAFHPEYNAALHFTPNPEEGRKLLESGFGIVLTHDKNGIGRGSSAVVYPIEATANEATLLSRAGMHFSFDKGNSQQDYPSSLMGSVALLRQAFYDAQWYNEARDREVNYSLEAHNAGLSLPQFFEITESNDLLRIENLAKEFEMSFIVKDDGSAYEHLEGIKSGIKALIIPLNFPEPFDMNDPELSRYISQEDLWSWKFAPYNPMIVSRSKIPFALSAGEAESFFSNLKKAVDSGLNEDTAMAALTISPAALLGLEKEIGKLTQGYQANFFVVKNNPFTEEEAKVFVHWIKGQPLVFKDSDALTFEGEYNLNVEDTYYDLIVEEGKKYKGKLSLVSGKDTLTEEVQLSFQGREVALSFPNPSGEGQYRLSGTILSDNRIWDGRGVNPFGKEITWSAIRHKKKRSQVSVDTLKTDSILPPPEIKYPLTAYGLTKLPEKGHILIKNATLWTNESQGVIEKGAILLSDGKILAVGKNVDYASLIPRKEIGNLVVIDGLGKHITPGIIDEHSHIAIMGGVNEGTQSSTAEVRIGDVINPKDINIYRQLAGGVTTAQLLHGSANPIGGQSAIIKLRWGADINEMVFEEAPGFIKFALGENVKQSNWGDNYDERYPQTRMGVEQFLYHSLLRAKEYGEKKSIYYSGAQVKDKRQKKAKKPEREALRTDLELEALLEILKKERFITCHSYIQSEINMLMHLADSLGFTLNTFTHILEGYKIADKLKSHGAAASTFSDWWAYKYEVKDAIPHNASILNQQGVLTAINSDDAEMGRRLNQEAAKSLLYGGMSEEDAIKMITLNPAKMLHIEEYVGSLAPGKHADIVLWSDHPLSVYAKAEKTFIDGKLYFDRDQMELLRVRDQIDRNQIAEEMTKAIEKGSKARKPSRKMERYYHCDTEN